MAVFCRYIQAKLTDSREKGKHIKCALEYLYQPLPFFQVEEAEISQSIWSVANLNYRYA